MFSADEFNRLPIEERKDLLWGPVGKGALCENCTSNTGRKSVSIYILYGIIISVHYSITETIVDIKAWGRAVEKSRIFENTLALTLSELHI